jgi:molybdopterin-binding protein
MSSGERLGEPVYAVRGLRAGFDGRMALAVEDLRVERGKVTVLVGENGSGKTTLLRVLNGLLAPLEGSVEFMGASLSADGRAALRARSVMVHQAPLLFRGTVAQNVGYGLRIRGVGRQETTRRVTAALDRVGLGGLERRKSSALSGGEKQRVALARALVLGAEVLLLDEPTANVDPESRAVVERIVAEEAASGATVILSTHAMEIAYRLCDALHRLEAGRILPPEENILRGRVEASDEEITLFRTGGVSLRCPARAGEFRVAVLPMNEIILSREPLRSSARNHFAGKVSGIEERGGVLVATVDCGVLLRALVTPGAVAELGVEVGREIVVTFKATSVRLY